MASLQSSFDNAPSAIETSQTRPLGVIVSPNQTFQSPGLTDEETSQTPGAGSSRPRPCSGVRTDVTGDDSSLAQSHPQLLLGSRVNFKKALTLESSLLLSKDRHGHAAVLNSLRPVLANSLKDYFDKIHPLNPIVNEDLILGRFAADVHLYDRAYASLLLIMCALSMLLPCRSGKEAIAMPQESSIQQRADDLFDLRCQLVSSGLSKAREEPTIESVANASMVGGYHQARGDTNGCHIKLYETVALASIVGLNHQQAMSSFRQLSEEQVIGIALFWKMRIGQR